MLMSVVSHFEINFFRTVLRGNPFTSPLFFPLLVFSTHNSCFHEKNQSRTCVLGGLFESLPLIFIAT